MTPSPLLLFTAENPKREQLRKRLADKVQRGKVFYTLHLKVAEFVRQGEEAKKATTDAVKMETSMEQFKHGYLCE